MSMESLMSGISQKEFPENELVSGKSLRPGIKIGMIPVIQAAGGLGLIWNFLIS
jgi:hypothetical protein